MLVFVTGATGWVGSAVVADLLAAGHDVIGLARSDEAAARLRSVGAEVHAGALEDLDSLRTGAELADGVIHLAYVHDFSKFEDNARIDYSAIRALGAGLAGSDRPLVIASGVPGSAVPGQVATERDTGGLSAAGGRRRNELFALSFAKQGVRAASVRLAPTVHGNGDHGFIARVIAIAREKGVSAYIGDGSNRWPAVHRLDAARLFCIALETAPAGTVLHGIGEEGIAIRAIAGTIGRQLDLPVVSLSTESARDHFGFLAGFLAADLPTSSAETRRRFDWEPREPGLIRDLESGQYFEAIATAA